MVDGDVVLRPYNAERDSPYLFRVLDDPIVWLYIPGGAPDSAAALATRFARRLAGGLRSTWVIEVAGDVVGTSSFILDPDDDAGVEIGSTYLLPLLWGSGVNRRAKRLMVSAAFDDGAAWVQFRTDERNLRSAAAILKLGAVELPAREDRWIRTDGTRRVSRFFRLFSGI
ncbi:GNAT family N-acetyltransferase [Micromonospora sp. NPDC023814]|uniref:GNAT family N-acetyltransferase n=1 Tax=Micromonospora sp. NPDC023814 TaxID=3154596 RepID=UPI0033EA00A2